MRYLLILALLASAAAHTAPVPNLALTCSDENAVGQNQDACDGIWAYETPTDALIVSAGPLGIWRRFDELIGADTVLVCTLPVEPGQYSSCRDAAGVRRTAFVRKDSIVAGGSVTVDKTGADYTDPVAAAQNAFAGDTWCVAPQWPAQPCVMAIGDGVFILHETLNIPEGLVVAGAGKGSTMLVADNDLATAVASFGNVRISGLTIINSQPGRARTAGLEARGPHQPMPTTARLHDAAIHVSGAAQNTAVTKQDVSLEILDSEITAEGQETTGITALPGRDMPTNMTVERSRVSATSTFAHAIEERAERGAAKSIRLLGSHIAGNVFFGQPNFGDLGEPLLQIDQSAIVGNVNAGNHYGRVVITGSSIKGRFSSVDWSPGGSPTPSIQSQVLLSNTYVEGASVRAFDTVVDTVTVQGYRLALLGGSTTSASIRKSYISFISDANNPLAGLTVYPPSVRVEHTFVQGAPAILIPGFSQLEVSSSVLAGPVLEPANGAQSSCTDTYGADYELLTASCQPQPPP